MRVVWLSVALCLLAGCGGSHNKGLIEGKWKFLETGEADAPLKNALLVFSGDGTVVLNRSDGVLDKSGEPRPPQWRYKLLAGDAADFYDLPADTADRFGLFRTDTGRTRVTVRIEVEPGAKYERRTMTLTDADGRLLRLVLTR
jgi:hypothetical protein